jgi:hypothetical protein
LLLAHAGAGNEQMLAQIAADGGDLTASLQGVQERRGTDETVITVIQPPLSAFVLGSAKNLVFLPGAPGSPRGERYTHEDASGRSYDYWLGVPALTTQREVCMALADGANSWIIVSDGQWNRWGFDSPLGARQEQLVRQMQDLIAGSASLVFEDGEARVYRVRPPTAWSEQAMSVCPAGQRRSEKNGAD